MHFNDNTLLLFGQVEGVFHPLTSKILAAASFAACALLRRLAIAGCCRKKRRGGRRHIITYGGVASLRDRRYLAPQRRWAPTVLTLSITWLVLLPTVAPE
jgi:hypothetical protein